MNTSTHTNKNHPGKKSSSSSKTPLESSKASNLDANQDYTTQDRASLSRTKDIVGTSDEPQFSSTGSIKPTGNYELQPHAAYLDQGTPLRSGQTKYSNDEVAADRERANTKANTGPMYLRDTWDEFVKGDVTDEQRNLVRTHCRNLGISENSFDALVARNPNNIQLLARLV